MTATISISVTPLTDNEIWFANAAAWTNYWDGVSGVVTLTPVATASYVSSPYNNSLAPSQITIDADVHVLATHAQLMSLKTELQVLNASYANLRTELYNAGLIDTP